jgi:1-aminocyclopropane-1-carboxylate deaminase/D-cysteine desulfhydrase-like pyridoxal-dependent ACC family enzyme
LHSQSASTEPALFALWPRLAACVPCTRLGEWPTPIQRLDLPSSSLWVKRDDLSSPAYGGNKVRTLEFLFGHAQKYGCRTIWATGAYGSNHALATAVHAPRVGLAPGVMLFPQPYSTSAVANLRATVSGRPKIVALPHWSLLPAAMLREHVRGGGHSTVMVPGGATPNGGLGYVSAGLELAQQIADGILPNPRVIVVGVGSTCTAAGLLVGLHHAARLGLGFSTPPTVVAARVTPWPVTSAYRIVALARRVGALLETLEPSLPAPSRQALAAALEVDGRVLGRGYGRRTVDGDRAALEFATAGGPALDSTYSAKSASAALGRVGGHGPVLYWATKSTAPLPDADPAGAKAAPTRIRRWLEDFRPAPLGPQVANPAAPPVG